MVRIFSMMKNFSRLILVGAALLTLPSCSLMSQWGWLTPRLKVVEKTTQAAPDGRSFITRRYQINDQPNETFTETLETREPWAATY